MGRRNPPNSSSEVAPIGDRSVLNSRWLNLLAAAAIAVAAIWVYSNSFSGPFVFDDGTWIESNKSIRQLWPIWPVLNPPNANVVGGRPVVSLTLALNYAFGGLNVWGYHAVNLLIHILAAWTLFGLVRRTLLLPLPSSRQSFGDGEAERDNPPPRFASVATPLAFAVALIWTVHPLQTAAVTYIIQRTESLVALFYLLTLYCVLRGATSQRAGRWWYTAAVVASLLGMATKEVMATAPLVALLYDRTFLSGSFARALRRRWGLYLALAASWGVIVWVLVGTHFHGGTTGFSAGKFNWWSYLLTQPGVLAHYLRMAVWPAGLCLDYRWPAPSGLGQIVPAGLLIVALLGLTIWALVKRPALGFLGTTFFLILAPTSSFVPLNDAAFDHRMYLPLAVLAVLAVVGGMQLCDWLLTGSQGSRRRRDEPAPNGSRIYMPLAALAVIAIALGWATFDRNRDFRSKVAIWTDTMQKRPGNARAPYSLGLALNEAGKPEAAVAAYEAALKIDPDYVDDLINLGAAYAQLRKFDLAIPTLEKALAVNSNRADVENNLASALASVGRMDEAADHLQKAIALTPDYADAHAALGKVLGQQGRLSEAVAQFEQALTIDPELILARNNFGALLDEHGQFDRAIEQYRAALALDPRNTDTRVNLAIALTRNHQTADAIAQFREAARSNPAVIPRLSRFVWDLATSPKASARNGAAAVALGQLALELAGSGDLAVLDAVAASYAEAGEFGRAADFERQALHLAEAQKRDDLIAGLHFRIELYESGQPFRMPPTP